MTDLLTRLKSFTTDNCYSLGPYWAIVKECADEIARLTRERDINGAIVDAVQATANILRDENARLTRERDEYARQRNAQCEVARLHSICRTIASGLRGQYATREDMALLAESGLPEDGHK